MSALRVFVLILSFFAAGQVCLAQSAQSSPSKPSQPTATAGQSSQASGEQPVSRKQYQVEIIVFQYLGPDSSGGETFKRVWVRNYLPPQPFDINRYNRLQDTVSYTGVTHLSDALQRLRADPRFDVMLATAWVQPLLDKNDAVAVPLGEAQNYDQGTGQNDQTDQTGDSGQQGSQNSQGSIQQTEPGTAAQDDQGGAPVSEAPGLSDTTGMQNTQVSSPGISGTMTVYGDHFLFVDLDLEARLPRSETGDTQQSSGTNAGADTESAPGDQLAEYHISQTRRIKLDEVQYFDHPYIGAIVSVSRYQGPPPGGNGTDQNGTSQQSSDQQSN